MIKKHTSYKWFLLWSFLLLISNLSFSQDSDVKVSGKLTDEFNIPLVGAKVVEIGTSNGATSDFDGNFQINTKNKSSKLEISYLGYITQIINVSSDFISVKMSLDVAALDEVVIIGYGQSKQSDLTGSVSSVDMEDVQAQPASNIGDAIQGRAAGVSVITSGQPGSNPTFRIRGTGTIGNNDPLIVVDGMPLNGGLNQVNMKDVKSLQVLKDASATAIYGSRGSNGVIIITTKRGKKGVSNLDIDTFTSLQFATNTLDVLNASQFAALSNEMLVNGGFVPNPNFTNPNLLGTGTNWLDAFLRNGMQKNITLSYSQGTEKTNLYTSFNVFDQEGIYINSKYTRYIAQFNSDTNINDNLKFGNSFKVNYDVKSNGDNSIQNAILSLPTQPIYDVDGNYTGPVGQALYSGDIDNPIGKSNIVESITKGYNLQGNVYGELTVLDNFKFKTIFGVEANFWDTRTWAPSYSWGSKISPNAFLSEGSNKSLTMLWDNTLTYNKEFDNGSSITGIIGTSAQENTFKYISGSIQGFISEQAQTINNGLIQPTINGSGSEWSIFSYFARAQYDFENKYYITATVRRDGSSRFGKGNKYGTFPSASLAWRLSKEEFLKNYNSINELKLRVGYGVTGNQNIGNYSFASSYNTNLYNFNNSFVTAAVPTVLPNTNVQWESQKQFNVGVDATLFDRFLDLTIDGYVKNTEDMLVPQSVPVTSGYSDVFVPYINAGKIQNKGVEVVLTTHNIERDKFNWSTDIVFAYNKNKVISINSDTPLTTGSVGLNYSLARIQPNYPINVFYGFVQDGVFQTQTEVDNAAIQIAGTNPQTSTAPGDIRFKDLNNDGIINDDDRTFIGNPNPAFTYSVNNTFNLGNFDLSVFIQGIQGNDIFNANRLYTENMSVTTNQSTAVLNRWTGAGTSNSVPRAIFGDPNNNNRPSSRYIEDGSYIRLKNINLAYNIPSEILNKSFFNSIKIYASAQNLITVTNYSGFDPEVGTNGIDNNTFPITKSFTLGATFGF
ncbi:SusC/RagA family TonB-linked outer membrane protein [Wenyingzhuangia marina]|uniref:TonB-linked outer membrane protein, SusC/RagA family n=1 Tax=Wenyingzhuangia marina TaxID=1195760 RepID=A0A1M5VCA8_9FLAO|nr:TonB-dependent receptor [Wenyingzhuangia marina]GGF73020.1 SusC/RagA family TonB-linked outer membrane protein [Wenyingzhuangia marina]SHH72880.1 TonB-linked outer membrane protein, SusC/RagA family [Wenyingzhuangia marina]